ncbi:AraC family transcriptional regulator [Paenibacillus allorhizosphaerae]|uniref:HTH-type transcriptional activator RhaR n=1 Tax=Paenibacillus allorhizosphaerae TaxID=2849866 RepID=A0ABN7TNK0_9BACL|nr:AraC family transcriptional regulator [Paenibacillus allorhizosphaerae]CAG7643469.1 HTH-type transcriptional activator RhaR [Paenibacillus allorhizosphaerae]
MTGVRPPLFDEYHYRCTCKKSNPLYGVPRYEIYYFHEGTGDFLLGDRVIRLAPGDLIITDGTTQHGMRVESRESNVHTMMTFSPSNLRRLEGHVSGIDLLLPFEVLGHDRMKLTGEARIECEETLGRIERFRASSDWIEFNRLVMAFFDLLVMVYAQCEPAMKAAKYTVTEKERHVRRVVAFIENAFNDDITLDMMQSELHISKQYMSKIFRERIGMTIFDYLYRRRIHQAKQLFYMQQAHTVTDICFQVGFKNVSHFSRLFKTQVGMTPERYRRQLMQGTALHDR